MGFAGGGSNRQLPRQLLVAVFAKKILRLLVTLLGVRRISEIAIGKTHVFESVIPPLHVIGDVVLREPYYRLVMLDSLSQIPMPLLTNSEIQVVDGRKRI